MGNCSVHGEYDRNGACPQCDDLDRIRFSGCNTMKQEQATQVKLCADCQHKANVHICWKCRNGDLKHITEACKYCGHQPTKLEAAAPALLAALEECIQEFERLQHYMDIGRSVEAKIAARNAINMATGKEG